METPPSNDAPPENNSTNETLQRQRSKEEDAATPKVATTANEEIPSPSPTHLLQPARRPSKHQTILNDGCSFSVATAADSIYDHRPRIKPCSLNPSTWSKRRVRIACCGCFSSAMVCTARLLLDPGPSAYIIHSIVILFDMILIHIFTYTTWLSIAGEITAIVFATCFHLTGLTVFELMETTLIAVYVSIHMIKSRNEHWDREEGLERDILGLQFYIEHNSKTPHNNENADEEAKLVTTRRQSSMSRLTTPIEIRRKSSENHQDEPDVESGDGGGGGGGGEALVPESDATNMSSFTTTVRQNGNENETGKSWWNHFFDHFLDGSAGVLYTSFLGLIIDEIVNLGPLSKATY